MLALRRLPRASPGRRRPLPAALRRLQPLCRPPGPPPPPPALALQALLGSRPFAHRRPDRFARAMAGWFPREAGRLPPATVALVALYLARHRLRQPPLLDAVAACLLRSAPRLDTKMIQKLVFPFSRTNYRPSNHPELFSQLESVLVQKAAASPLATVNILMSLVQLGHFPLAVLHKVFSPGFLDHVTSGPCGLIVRRYLSLLDVAVALEAREYDGPRLDPQHRVCMFDGALTADEVNHKYSYKGLVAEALRQLVGEEGYRQNEVVPPGYCADFLLQVSHLGSVLPRTSQDVPPLEAPASQTLPSDPRSRSLSRQQRLGSPWIEVGGPPLPAPQEPCPGTTGGNSLAEPPCSVAEAAPWLSPPAQDTGPQQHLAKERRLPPTAPVASPQAVPGRTEEAEEIQRIVLSVNDKWHYCQNSAVLVGSRAMRDRHLRLLGYHLVQLSYVDLERVSGLEGAKQYLCQKLRCLQEGQRPGPLGGCLSRAWRGGPSPGKRPA